MTAERWPDGCPRIDDHPCGGHQLDGICRMTRPEKLPPAEPEPDECGGAT